MAKKQAASAPALSADLQAKMQERESILQWLSTAKARELELRRELAAALCPSPTEGVNKVLTADGYEVTIEHKINRKLDAAVLDTVMPAMSEEWRVLGTLIQYKPDLVMSGYRALPEDQLKIFQQAVTETPGTPDVSFKKLDPQNGQPPTAAPADAPAQQTMAAPSPASSSVPEKPKAKKAGGKKGKK